MNYIEALEYTHSFLKFGIKPGLERTENLLKMLGEPQKNLKFIHIAGTNGKGSVANMSEAILRYAGYKTGLYISPYVVDFRERIQVCGEMIPQESFANLMSKIKTAVDSITDEALVPTEFELITAAAMLYFAEQKCDVVVLETGMGGRFDATNVIEKPLACVITAMSMDHMAVLGDTIEKITAEKAGIIKNGCPVVVYPKQPDGVMKVINETAAEKNSTVIVPNLNGINVLKKDLRATSFYYNWEGFAVAMPGEHQIYNAITAVEAVKASGLPVRQAHLFKGVYFTRFAGRFEKICENPLVYIDGAHNRAGIDALTDTVKQYMADKKVIAVMGILKDKEYLYGINKIAEISEKMYITEPKNDRALSASEASKIAKQVNSSVTECDSITEAVEKALTAAAELGEDAVVICTGSLYLISEIRSILTKNITTNQK